MLDPHYTPRWLATRVVEKVALENAPVIADFASGEGSLLEAAHERWPGAQIVATDADPKVVRGLRRQYPHWKVGRADFLNPASRRSCPALRDLAGQVSLLLLNPPFTSRGGAHRIVKTRNGPVRAGIAMAFLLESCTYLAPSGEAVAILPAGALHNAKDRNAWIILRQEFSIRTLERPSKNSFRGCVAASVIVSLRRRKGRVARPVATPAAVGSAQTLIIRGTFPAHAHSATSGDGPGTVLVHSTDLKDARVRLNGRRGHGSYRCISGPAVLIPRVGQLTQQKIALLRSRRRIMLSDCVIGLKGSTPEQTHRLHEALGAHFLSLKSAYVGTGAPHITLPRLHNVLAALAMR